MSAFEGVLSRITPSKLVDRLFGDYLQILAYHGISDDDPDDLTVSPASFRAQMTWLADRGVRVITLGDALDRIARGFPLKNNLVLTFDDGYADFLDTVAPVLNQLGFPATLFVVTGKLGRLSDWNRDTRARMTLGLENLRCLSVQGYSIGSHSATHARLTDLLQTDLEDELMASRLFLDHHFGVGRRFLAYPYGDVDARVRAVADEAGYECGCGIGGYLGNGANCDRLALHRVVMRRRYSLPDFQSIVADWYKRPLVNWPLGLGRRPSESQVDE